MRYYLSIDKGAAFKNKERFIKLYLPSFEEELNDKTLQKLNLNKDNNLRYLCNFTMHFKNEKELREFLISKNILPKEYAHLNIRITYFREHINSLTVPYIENIAYFDLEALNEIIRDHIFEEPFKSQFIGYFKKNGYLTEEYFELVKALHYAEPYIVYDRIRAFMNALIIKNGKIKFRELYNIAMFTFAISKQKEQGLAQEPPKEYSNLYQTEKLTEVEQFELESLLDRKDKNQTSLFR